MEIIRRECLNGQGFIELIDMMGSDLDIANAARVSTGKYSDDPEKNKQLIRYLFRHQHTSPFEMVELKFRVKVPIFIARQWIRHRTASVNEISGRYSILKNEFYVPDIERIKGKGVINKQDSEGDVDEKAKMIWLESLRNLYEHETDLYNYANENKISNEIARINLPVSTFTEFIWKIDLHNLFNFLKLRGDSHAQLEIRQYADAIEDIIQGILPISYQAFVDFKKDSLMFSAPELSVLKTFIKPELLSYVINNANQTLTDSEKKELVEKLEKIQSYDRSSKNIL
jgi:thymidylate synthase (FAD)